MTCSSCQTSNRPAANFCRSCGEALPGRHSIKAVSGLVLASLSVLALGFLEVAIAVDWTNSKLVEIGGFVACVLAVAALAGGILALMGLRDVATRRVADGAGVATVAILICLVGLLGSLVLTHVTIADARQAWDRTEWNRSEVRGTGPFAR